RFEMCEDCRAEYEDPADRRFHAQPIACPLCGPSLRLSSRAGDAIDETARVLGAGRIVAIKGLGGYHLACDATDESAVAELRRRKAREEKPLAVMAADLDAARLLGHVSPEEAALLSSRRRPIVLLRKTEASDLAPSIAPGNRYLGVMLPYTPLHHLLLTALGRPVVLTSGNMSDEPIAYEDGDAAVRLASVADAFLTHDRAIHMRCDDSVVRVSGGREYPIRRSRGYAPEPISLSRAFTEPILAAGPELKHTFCIGVGERAVVSHHIGDLESYEAMSAFVEAVEHYEQVFNVKPQVVAHDLHPEYLSTKWARSLDDVALIGVQHHHAHVASCLADNDRWEPVIGLALDGTGLGDDGTLWGCEVLVCDASSYERVGHLRNVPLPGAAQAIKEPWRMAAIYLNEAFGPDAALLELEFVERTGRDWKPLLQMAATGTNSPLASSAGRLFDAAAALCGVRDRVSYEGQAAAELEQLADETVTDLYPCPVADGVIDGVMLIAALASDLAQGRPAPAAAAAFHNGFVRALIELCEQTRAGRGLQTVALSGGTFQNLLLLEGVRAGLHERGFEVLTHRRVPTNDGGISLGQAVVANASRSRR
ncbi:MAG: carbamoyltransferase HypF, partial [Actinomycetota bacterium]